MQEQPTTRVSGKAGLWSPIEKQDTADPEALPRFLAMLVYSSHLESAFRYSLPVLVFCRWKHKAACRQFTVELDSMILVGPVQLRIFCDSEIKFIVQNRLGEAGLEEAGRPNADGGVKCQAVMLGMAQPKSRVSLSSDPCISLLLFTCGWMILTFVSKCKYTGAKYKQTDYTVSGTQP